MSDTYDIQVVESVLAGNTDDFSKIVEKYQDRVFRYVFAKLSNYDEAMDVTQEIFIMTLEALASFRRESKFSTWFFSIMINYCKNYHKKRGRFTSVPLTFSRGEEEYELQIPDHRENPEERVIMHDSLRILREEIQRLPEDYREILVLRDIDGLSYNEISDILNINLSNVKVRIHRGREFLKNRLHSRGLV
ncbi:MAG: RNA polymerase sigma factor [Spirochaetes bacterium]|nr:RNA polymerase sigma factor [Spirochaetota bacterium]